MKSTSRKAREYNRDRRRPNEEELETFLLSASLLLSLSHHPYLSLSLSLSHSLSLPLYNCLMIIKDMLNPPLFAGIQYTYVFANY